MLTLFLVILVILIVINTIFFLKAKKDYKKSDYDLFNYHGLYIVYTIFTIVILTLFFINLYKLQSAHIIDEKIAMYEEENTRIERELNQIITSYLNHESDIYTHDKEGEYLIQAILAYPELNSQELVSDQIEVYIDNNQTIKNYKLDKIDLSLTKWLLYFGT